MHDSVFQSALQQVSVRTQQTVLFGMLNNESEADLLGLLQTYLPPSDVLAAVAVLSEN